MKLKFVGSVSFKKYSGLDFITGKQVTVVVGDEVEVSDEKGEQLLKDFKKNFKALDAEEEIENIEDVEEVEEVEEIEEVEEEEEEEAPVKKAKKKKKVSRK